MVTEERIHKEEGKKVLRTAAEGAAGFALAFAEPLGLCAPFGIAVCSGAKADAGGLCCLFGTMLGYLLSRGADGGLRYCAAALLGFTVTFVFRDTPAMERKWFLPTATGLITLLCGVLSFFEGASPLHTVLRLALELGLASVGSRLFSLLRQEKRELSEKEQTERLSGMLLLYAAGIMSLCRVSCPGGLMLGHIPAILTALLFAWAGGSVKGCVAGVVMGLCTLLSTAGNRDLTVCCALGGLLGGFFCNKSRSLAALMFLGGFLLPLLPLWSREQLCSLGECALALLGFFCLPKKLLRTLSERICPCEAEDGEELLRSYGAVRTGELARSLRELYESVSGNTPTWEEEDISTVYDRAAECVCAGCLRKELCWHTEYLRMLSGLNDATEVVRRRGKLSMQELPERFRESCVHPEAFLQAVNGELRAVSYRRQLRARLEENRMAAYGQLRVLSSVLDERSRALGAEQSRETNAERKLRRYFRAHEMDCRITAFRDADGHLRVLLEGDAVAALKEQTELSDRLSAVVGVKLCRLHHEKNDRMLFTEAERYQPAVAIAAVKKQGEAVSGDRGTWFKTENGKLCLLLSDGMGSGEEASREAIQTVRELESLLRSGVAAAEALELVNALMLLKNGDSWSYATVDLVTVDLYSGESAFYKFGAAPSYVRLQGEVKRLRGVSLAAGILSGENEKKELLTAELREGDILLVCSDGVASEQDDGWLRSRLESFEEGDPGLLARELVEEAVRQYGRYDDMTVIALRMEAGRE